MITNINTNTLHLPRAPSARGSRGIRNITASRRSRCCPKLRVLAVVFVYASRNNNSGVGKHVYLHQMWLLTNASKNNTLGVCKNVYLHQMWLLTDQSIILILAVLSSDCLRKTEPSVAKRPTFGC